jgi:hypothetical protein
MHIHRRRTSPSRAWPPELGNRVVGVDLPPIYRLDAVPTGHENA